FQAEDGIRDFHVTGVQTCALPISKVLPETSEISLGVTMVAFVVGSLAITFTNGGFGAFPLMIAEVLALYGIPLTAGTALGWILWTSQTILVITLGGLAFLLLPLLNKAK